MKDPSLHNNSTPVRTNLNSDASFSHQKPTVVDGSSAERQSLTKIVNLNDFLSDAPPV